MASGGRCEWQTSQFDLRLGRRTVSAVCSRDVPNADYGGAIKRPDGVSSLRAELTPGEIAVKAMALC
jgi:hypothetical protein